MPTGVSIQSHSGCVLKSSTKPSLPGSVCRNCRCAGSMAFSLTCIQLHSQTLAHRVGAVEQPVLQGAVGRLARRFEDRAAAAEEPAMVAAANPGLLDQSEFERGAAMRAVQLEQPDLAAAVT